MRHTTLDQLQRVAAVHVEPPAKPPMTRAEKIEVALASLRTNNKVYETLRAVEYADVNELRARSTDGTILEPVAEVLGVEHTHGAVMDELDPSRDDLHHAFCEYKFGNKMNGKQGCWELSHVLSPHVLAGHPDPDYNALRTDGH